MIRKSVLLAAVLMLAAAVISHGQTQATADQSAPVEPAPLTNDDIVKMVKAGLPGGTVIATIRSSPSGFDTSPAALQELKSAGVPDSVIEEMVKRTKPQPGARQLWIAKFTGEDKAAAAIAAAQQDDVGALRQSSLFSKVTSFSTDATQPAGTWLLSANEVGYSGGSTAKRVIVGYGTGRAHLELEYKLANPTGTVVWTKRIKTEPSFWSSTGAVGGVQDQAAAVDKQPQKLLDELAKFFASQH
jgi:hypothetical protein